MSASRPCPAHTVYGLAVALAFGLGLFTGIACCSGRPRPAEQQALPDDFGRRFGTVEHGVKLLIKRQIHLLKRAAPQEEWDLP